MNEWAASVLVCQKWLVNKIQFDPPSNYVLNKPLYGLLALLGIVLIFSADYNNVFDYFLLDTPRLD